MGWLKRVFGHGKVRIEFTATDRDGTVRSGTAKTVYEGEFDEKEILRYFREEVEFEHDCTVTKAEITQHISY